MDTDIDETKKIPLRENLSAQIAFRGITAAIGLAGTIYKFVVPNLADDGGVISPALYYTYWSTWFATAVAIVALISSIYHFVKKDGKNGTWIPVLKFCSTIFIIATFVVAAFVLPDKIWMASYWSVSGTLVHFLLPILTVLDTILFQPKRSIRVSYPFYGVIPALLYWVILIIVIEVNRSNYGGSIPEAKWDYYYPYGFTNFDNGATLGGLIGLLAGIAVGLILIGFLFWLFDKRVKDENGKGHFVWRIDEENMNDFYHRHLEKKNAGKNETK